VEGLPDFKVERTGVCKRCELDKHAKDAFPSNEHKSRGILDLVHSNVCGPVNVNPQMCLHYWRVKI
jgi:hypothetical protein